MARFTDAALPYADAAIAGASIVAQVLLAMRRAENWALWIAINVLSVWVYVSRELYLTAGLYVMFLCMAIAGLIAWARAARAGEAIAA
jgi:nicotinamide mononucleotide transporter